MRTWEYHDGYDLDVDELDEYGADGWELVATCTVGRGHRFVFKRPLVDTSVGATTVAT